MYGRPQALVPPRWLCGRVADHTFGSVVSGFRPRLPLNFPILKPKPWLDFQRDSQWFRTLMSAFSSYKSGGFLRCHIAFPISLCLVVVIMSSDKHLHSWTGTSHRQRLTRYPALFEHTPWARLLANESDLVRKISLCPERQRMSFDLAFSNTRAIRLTSRQDYTLARSSRYFGQLLYFRFIISLDSVL